MAMTSKQQQQQKECQRSSMTKCDLISIYLFKIYAPSWYNTKFDTQHSLSLISFLNPIVTTSKMVFAQILVLSCRRGFQLYSSPNFSYCFQPIGKVHHWLLLNIIIFSSKVKLKDIEFSKCMKSMTRFLTFMSQLKLCKPKKNWVKSKL
jgi:hypothetical protein